MSRSSLPRKADTKPFVGLSSVLSSFVISEDQPDYNPDCNSKSSQEINKIGGFHDTALKAAASLNNEKVVEILIASGAEVNFKRGGFPVQLCKLLPIKDTIL
jgi:hypothetical protein